MSSHEIHYKITSESSERQFPEDQFKQLEAVLAAFNAAPKAVTHLIICNSAASFSPTKDIIDEFRMTMRGSEFSRVDRMTPITYCLATLVPIGMVAEEVSIPSFGVDEELVGFRPTKKGIDIGAPIAAAQIMYEVEHGYSLYPVLGNTGKKEEIENRTPLLRCLILLELSDGITKTTPEIAKNLGIDAELVGKHLARLKTLGAVEYDSRNVYSPADSKKIFYHVTDVNMVFEPHAEFPLFSKKIQDVVLEMNQKGLPIDRTSVAEYSGIEIKRNNLLQISYILAYFERQGFFEKDELSSAVLTAKGVDIAEYLQQVIAAVQGDTQLEVWRNEMLPKVLANFHQYAVASTDLYYPFSMSYQHTRDNDSLFIDLLGQHSRGLTIKSIAQELGVSVTTAKRLVKKARQKYPGQITTTKDQSKGYLYGMKSQD